MRRKRIAPMTARERVEAAADKEKTDRRPWALWMTDGKAEETPDLVIAPDWRDRIDGESSSLIETGVSLAAKSMRKFKNSAFLFPVYSPLLLFSLKQNRPYGSIPMDEGTVRELERITEISCELSRQLIALGADGIMLVTDGSYDKGTEAFYKRYGQPYDLAVLGSATGGWCNTLRAEGNHVLFQLFRKYPVRFFSCEMGKDLSLELISRLSPFAFLGGLPKAHMKTETDTNLLLEDYLKASSDLSGAGWIAGSDGPVSEEIQCKIPFLIEEFQE